MQLVHVIHTNYKKYKKYKSYNDLNVLETEQTSEYKPKIIFQPPPVMQYPKECVSYSVFLQKNPGASKKQRIEAIQRFYDSLY
jgi:hypothetical protein